MLPGKVFCQTQDQFLRIAGVSLHHLNDLGHVDRSMVLMPGVIIRHHCHRAVANLSLPRELRFRHIRHANDTGSPRPVELGFSKR